ncbi:MAG: hypothetical protein NT154_05505, partial [Verrucomicrobia bacterium]|nr:hypothetical protein [Verrucomicrobiota bacterium]
MKTTAVSSAWTLIMTLLLAGNTVKAETTTNAPSADKTPYARDLSGIRRTVETLRGKKFQQDVPAFTVSEAEMRSIVDRELSKDYPGRELADYQALMAWLDILPPGTDLKSVFAELFVGDAAGFYDTDTKEMCIPASIASTNAWKNPAKKEVEKLSPFSDDLIFAHEFTHALEDQYWPLDDPNEKARQESTDRATARSFLAEGAATRLMIEAIPALLERESSVSYVTMWNLVHSGMAELVLDYVLSGVWKSSDCQVPGVPETLVRAEAMPYSYGYTFCSDLMRNWGLDGLDYLCNQAPVSTAQIIHPEK